MERYKRKIIQIHEDKCNGCGLCVTACHEGAIQMVDGKAKLISDQYCDGLGDCLPSCPTGAIEIIEREAEAFNEELVMAKMAEKKAAESVEGFADELPSMPCGCPGSAAQSIKREAPKAAPQTTQQAVDFQTVPSQLGQWPVQLDLINPTADYLQGADLLIAADCTAYAYGNFHQDFIKGKVTVIGCPKLDNVEAHTLKLTEIIRLNALKSITVVRMSVPCCGGIIMATQQAMLNAKKIVPYKEVVIGTDGSIISQ